MIRLTKEKILALRRTFAKRTGCDAEPRDEAPIDKALAAVYARTPTAGDALPLCEEKAAKLAYELTTKHAFKTGNASFGMFLMLVFLEANGLSPTAESEEITAVGLSLGSGRMRYSDLVAWVCQHVR